MFDAAVESFWSLRRRSQPDCAAQPPARSAALIRALVTEEDYDRPLAVQMAALLQVCGLDAGTGGQHVAGLLELVLGLEYAHWDQALPLGPDSNLAAAVKNGVALATLVGGVETAEAAAALIGGDPLYATARDIDVPRVQQALGFLFPAADGGLATLEPDLIGEHHVAEVATDALVAACLDSARTDQDKRRHILTVLNRVTRKEHGAMAQRAEIRLARLVETRGETLGADLVRVAVETPGKLIELCAALEAQVEQFGDEALA
ncbi:hypothetical protein, partial [Bradyrhizobium sp.]|uniref:hypothetical protein n=1 Tax=Bradyrhizobium sp. TaxID=376 RepID=UPI003C284D5F